MKFKDKIIKLVLVGLMGSIAINLMMGSSSLLDVNCEKGALDWACNQSVIVEKPISVLDQTNSPLLGYLFQLMFILFFISPPLMVVMLYMIWQELKKRNEMK